jgi:hypothetical protein
MKKNILLGLSFFALTFVVEGVETDADATAERNKKTNEKYEILRRDQIDTTDTLAIPFDDSEVEDEEEVNRAEKREVFDLPRAPEARQTPNLKTTPTSR